MADIRYTITKLNGENYQVWSYKAEMLLIKEGLWDVTVAEMPVQPDAEWRKKDGQARATIALLIEDNQLIHIRQATTAMNVWKALKEYHQKATLSSKVFLLRQICSLKFSDGKDMEEHISTMLDLVNKLTALGEKLVDHLIVAMLLSSLPESYSTLITALESRAEKELTLDLVKGKLIDEFKRRKHMCLTHDTGDIAMKTQHGKDSKDKGSGVDCYFCKKSGHMKKDCLKYKRWKANKERANQVKDEANNNSKYVCFTACKDRYADDAWYIDSGATTHMTRDISFFDTLDKEFSDAIRLANGDLLQVKGKGTGKLKCLNKQGEEIIVEIKDVLYVPSLDGNLISVKKLTEKGFEVSFGYDHCCISKQNITFAIGILKSNLYQLKISEKALKTESLNNHKENCQHVWH